VEADELSLTAIGLTARAERAYRALVRRRHGSPAEVSRDIVATVPQARSVLEELEAKGFASRMPGRAVRFVAVPPEVAVEAAVHRQLEGIARARDSARRLADDFRNRSAARAPVEVVEVVLGREAVIQRWAQLQELATRELLAFDRPPYSMPVPGVNPDEDVALRRGVHYRIIYSREALEWPGMLPHIERYVEAGEDARVLPEVPMKLDVVDQKLGLVPLTLGDPGRVEGALLVHPSPLLETLAFLFEAMWESAVPFHAALDSDGSATDERSEERTHLLALMAAGMKDEVIARQLGVGLRTLHRRVAALMKELGADTRYQAGLQAARRGWYGEASAG
jgi:sugar-specific transcriptional regulator TrmB